jgi:hypothetical protein
MQAADLDRGLTSERARFVALSEPGSLPWSRPARLLFLVAAAALCWAAPVIVVYFLVS